MPLRSKATRTLPTVINRRIGVDLMDLIPWMRGLCLFAGGVDWQEPDAAFEVKWERGTVYLKCSFPLYQHEYYVILLPHIAPMPPDMRRIASW